MLDSLIPIRCGLLAQLTWTAIASWVAIMMVLFIVFGSKSGGGAACRHSGGRGKKLVAGMLLLVGLLFGAVFFPSVRFVEQQRPEQVHAAHAAASQLAGFEHEQMQRVLELEQAQAARAQDVLNSMSMHQLWEKLHASRIELDGNTGGAAMAVSEGPANLDVPASGETGVAVTGPPSDQSSASQAESLARLERVVAQTTAVADRVSETGTLLGRAMIALIDSIDSRSRAESPVKATLSIAEAQAEPLQAAAAPASPAPERTVEIQFEIGKLQQEGLTFDRARSILGKDGYWRGNKVRFDPIGHHIAVTGRLEPEFESRLTSTLLGTTPKSGRAIHVSDVAAVTPHPDAIEIGAAEANTKSAGRPAWVDGPPKRVGNTRREVIVAGEYATREECNRAADIYLLLATYNHLQQLTGESDRLAGGWHPDLKFDGPVVMADGEILIEYGQVNNYRLRQLSRYGIGIDFVRREIAKDEYLETVDRSFGPMLTLSTLVEFTPSVDAELMRRWNEYRRDERLFAVGAGAGSVLGMIGLALGLLKVDTWTKGYYSKRLFLGVPATIIGVLALLSLLGV